jgi:hypothetical protein
VTSERRGEGSGVGRYKGGERKGERDKGLTYRQRDKATEGGGGGGGGKIKREEEMGGREGRKLTEM